VGGVEADVTEPAADEIDLGTGLEQVNGRGVPPMSLAT
jgi:hypothetical protein